MTRRIALALFLLALPTAADEIPVTQTVSVVDGNGDGKIDGAEQFKALAECSGVDVCALFFREGLELICAAEPGARLERYRSLEFSLCFANLGGEWWTHIHGVHGEPTEDGRGYRWWSGPYMGVLLTKAKETR